MNITFAPRTHPKNGAAVYFVTEDGMFDGMAGEANEAAGGALERAVAASRFKAGKGDVLEILSPAGTGLERLILVGLGKGANSEGDFLVCGAAATAKLLTSGSVTAGFVIDDTIDPVALAEGALLRSYRFDKYRTKEPETKKPSLHEISLLCAEPDAAKDGFSPRKAVSDGVFLTRDLISEPANILYPKSFADRIRELADIGIDVEVLGETEMDGLGMQSLLAVGQGSQHDSQLVIMRWMGGEEDDAPLAFIGKGVTFDTGGISIKPSEGMDQMKWDMGGAGIVVGLMKALAGRNARVNVVGVVGLVENMPSGTAQRPGDVVTSMSGQTIEVLNTDAEGRLVLADALWYCQDRFKPRLMIDLATLTGAMIVALGHEYAGFFTDDDAIADGLFAAGADTGDKTWRLPLHDSYDKLINTPTADMKNIGGRGAGSITAAQFLKRFTNDVPWAHIDVAGTVWSDKDLPLSEKGGTGYGVRLLDRFVADGYEPDDKS